MTCKWATGTLSPPEPQHILSVADLSKVISRDGEYGNEVWISRLRTLLSVSVPRQMLRGGWWQTCLDALNVPELAPHIPTEGQLAWLIQPVEAVFKWDGIVPLSLDDLSGDIAQSILLASRGTALHIFGPAPLYQLLVVLDLLELDRSRFEDVSASEEVEACFVARASQRAMAVVASGGGVHEWLAAVDATTARCGSGPSDGVLVGGRVVHISPASDPVFSTGYRRADGSIVDTVITRRVIAPDAETALALASHSLRGSPAHSAKPESSAASGPLALLAARMALRSK